MRTDFRSSSFEHRKEVTPQDRRHLRALLQPGAREVSPPCPLCWAAGLSMDPVRDVCQGQLVPRCPSVVGTCRGPPSTPILRPKFHLPPPPARVVSGGASQEALLPLPASEHANGGPESTHPVQQSEEPLPQPQWRPVPAVPERAQDAIYGHN